MLSSSLASRGARQGCITLVDCRRQSVQCCRSLQHRYWDKTPTQRAAAASQTPTPSAGDGSGHGSGSGPGPPPSQPGPSDPGDTPPEPPKYPVWLQVWMAATFVAYLFARMKWRADLKLKLDEMQREEALQQRADDEWTRFQDSYQAAAGATSPMRRPPPPPS